MTPKLHEPAGRVQFGIIKKFTCAFYFQFARETMLLFVNNIEENVRDKNTRNTTVLISRSLPFTFSFKNFKFTLITFL